MPCSVCVSTSATFDFATRTLPRPRPQSRMGTTSDRLTYCWSSGLRHESFSRPAVCDRPNRRYRSAFNPRLARACASALLLSSLILRYMSGSGLWRYACSNASPSGTSKRGTLSSGTTSTAVSSRIPRNERKVSMASSTSMRAFIMFVSSFRRFTSSWSISFSVMLPMLYRPRAYR